MQPLQDSRKANLVVVTTDSQAWCYPPLDQAPFHPGQAYPEYPAGPVSDQPNPVYDMVRRTLADLGLDRMHFGTTEWNPFGDLVRPGARVVIKPNWVNDHNLGAGGWECLITHPSILRAVIDYVLLARPADVLVGDSPIQDCDLGKLLALGVTPVMAYFRECGAPIRLADFRRTTLRQDGFAVQVTENIRPLEDYVIVDLGADSLLEPISCDAARFRVTKYDPRKMRDNHRPGVHRYLIARDILRADLVVNLPKLKTHKKAGITAALKNLVGINGNKDFLPHHRKGPASSDHGDCYRRFNPLKALAEEVLDFINRYPGSGRLGRRLVYALLVLDMKLGGDGDVEGSWRGNDTLWRTCLDLNRILLYADERGGLHPDPQRTELSLVDAIIGGDGEGPLKPMPCPLKMLIASFNPAICDWVCAKMMRLNPDSIPILKHVFSDYAKPIVATGPQSISCVLQAERTTPDEAVRQCGRTFQLAGGWKEQDKPFVEAVL